MLSNLKIGVRLAIGFGISMALMCALGAFALWQINRVDSSARDIADNWLPSVQTLGDVRGAANAVRRASLRIMLDPSNESRKAQMKQHGAAADDLTRLIDAYAKLVSSDREAQMLQDIRTRLATYRASDERMMKAAVEGRADDPEERAFAAGPSSVQFLDLMKAIEANVVLNREGSEAAKATAAASSESARWGTGLLIAASLFAAVAVAMLITRSITRPIERAVALAETVAKGDLTSSIEVEGRDEAANLLRALGEMNGRLASLVYEVRTSSENIATSASEIAAGNIDLSQRTEQQAASLEETAASMEELTSTVRQSAENALQGNTLAQQASNVAEQGGAVVARVVDTMSDISNSAGRVADIISVIEGIAFQTNILALNAAVEAARAGEEGRGFAVVAGEVRTLAQRSASAAKEIKELIGESVDGTQRGCALVTEAGDTIRDVVSSVGRVTGLMQEINEATGEQHRGIEQVNIAVAQMDQVTQQNAALVEQAAAAAESLAGQAGRLKELVSVFRLPAAA
ncbi:methyl-accepting chemotaxis protein [Burkholderia sp. WSM2232]|uniref:methyl-accepting chemotaxis protein n=1 Tax=Burkholderia sp. WSM2232 TaxID=944436 RepID=UPI00042A4F50|nr:methyl-accepting chemotaxis protein [Burkholderia sp. WSM2232]